MDKNIINEELEKFRLLSSYSTKKTLSENIEEISEQYKTPEEEIFYTLVRATSGFGTNEDLLIKAFQKFQNYGQLLKVEKMLNDRPIAGQKYIAGLLRSELGSSDGPTIKKIADAAKAKGISINYTMGGPNKNQLNNNKITISPVKSQPIGDVPVTASGKSDEPTGDLAKVKTLDPVVVVGKKPSTSKPSTSKPSSAKPTTPEVTKQPSTQPVEPVTLDRERPDLSTGVPKTLPTQAPTIQTPTTELSLEQQFQMAKMKLDAAKKELDAAQETRDRAKIGAARGKQQAARAEVQRLRNELYPPQQ